VENFKPWIPFSTWDQRELRVEKNTHRLLDLFDSVNLDGKTEARGRKAYRLERQEARMPGGSEDSVPSGLPASPLLAGNSGLSAKRNEKSNPKATFFILGWIAAKLPNLVREIYSRRHEVASHGLNHVLPDKLPAAELKQDLTESKKLLEDITGGEVAGYRAPSFAVNDDVLRTIEDCGYRYDSSYNSFAWHGRYGKISLNGSRRKGIASKISENFFELPVSNLEFKSPLFHQLSATSAGQKVGKRVALPWGGGGYFRLMPANVFKWGIKSILIKNNAYLFYAHPWEIDPNQPKVNNVSSGFKFRHYTNLNSTEKKFRNLIESFAYCRFVTCREYLNGI